MLCEFYRAYQVQYSGLFTVEASLYSSVLVDPFQHDVPSTLSPEPLSCPVEDGGPSGHATPSDDRSLSSDDVSLSSQSDESLSAKVER